VTEEKLLTSLMILSTKKQLAFGLLIIQRMLPDLIAFSNETGFEDSCYLQTKDAAWRAIEGAPIDKMLGELCIRNAPDTEEYANTLTSYALNTTLAISDIVKFCGDGQLTHITSIVSLAHDSVDLYLSTLEPSPISSPFGAEDNQHPLMQKERQQEREDIEFLSNLPNDMDGEAIAVLKGRATLQNPLLPLSS